jgi:tetratricopeptide (TPR) repeat protein
MNIVLKLLLLWTAAFTLATVLQPRTTTWSKRGNDSNNVLKLMLGDGRRLFANHFFVKADISFHSGYYPSIFDQKAEAPKDARHMTAEEGHHGEEEHEKEMDFLGKPRDWIEAFGRRFMITEHTHLSNGKEREILPWLRLSAELDPQRIDTYTVAAYWLRELGKFQEAEQFLRDGLRANPNSYEILFELGRLYYENYKEAPRARNVWELALRRWQEQEPSKKEPDLFVLSEISVHLAHLEEEAGNYDLAIGHLELALKASPVPGELQKQIEELKRKRNEQSKITPKQP